MGSGFWWGKMILIALFSLFFRLRHREPGRCVSSHKPFGIHHVFFSASLMILVSIVGILYPAFQVHAHLSLEKNHPDEK